MYISNSGRYTEVSFANISTGTDLTGHSKIIFNQEQLPKEYDKRVQIELYGSYINPVTKLTEQFSEKRELSTKVVPANTVTPFETKISQLALDTDVSKTTIYARNIEEPEGSIENVGWFATEVTKTYKFNLHTGTNIQQQKLEITIDRKTDGTSKISDGHTVNWGQLDDDLGTPVPQTNQDGSITYTFTKGEDSDTYNQADVFEINKDYTIQVKYDIPNTNPSINGVASWPKTAYEQYLKQASTNITFQVKSDAKGWKVLENWIPEQEKYELDSEKISSTDAKSDFNTVSLYSYNPGRTSWMEVSTGEANSDVYDLVKIGQMDIPISLNTKYHIGTSHVTNGSIICANPILVYYDDDKTLKTIELTNAEIALKSIQINSQNPYQCESVLKSGGASIATLTEINSEHQLTDYNKISNFNIETLDFINKRMAGYDLVYTLYKDGLQDRGLSETEISNIMNIQFSMNTDGDWIAGRDTAVVRFTDSEGSKYSYMELDIGGKDYDDELSMLAKPQAKTIRLQMYKNPKTIKGDQIVKNENPTFYLKLPDTYIYGEMDIDITPNPYIYIKETDRLNVDGTTYIVVECAGTYDSSIINSRIDIICKFTRYLIDYRAEETQTVEAYMLTDNEHYISSVYNAYDFNKGDKTPNTIFRSKQNYKIEQSTARIQNYMNIVQR